MRCFDQTGIHRVPPSPLREWVNDPPPSRRLRARRRHALAQPSGPVTVAGRVVVDVGMIVPDDLGIFGRSCGSGGESLGHWDLLVPTEVALVARYFNNATLAKDGHVATPADI